MKITLPAFGLSNVRYEQDRIFTVYGYSFKNIGGVGSWTKKDAGICSQIDYLLCEGT